MRLLPGKNLIIVHTRGKQNVSDWLAVAERIKARAPDIRVRVVDNGHRNKSTRLWQILRPSLVFSPVPLHRFSPAGGKLYHGLWSRHLPKETELKRMLEAGIAVPATTHLAPGIQLKGAPWEPYVIVKPAHGGKGRMIRLVRTADLARRYDELTRGGTIPMLVQEYIDHVDERGHPTGYRLLTLFGTELYFTDKRWKQPRRALEELADDPEGIIANNDGSAPVIRGIASDEDVLALGRKVGRVFSEVPVLGIDIIRQTGTGKLYVTETNPAGDTWHLSSPHGHVIYTPELRQKMYDQFGALDRIADLLIEKTRAEAK